MQFKEGPKDDKSIIDYLSTRTKLIALFLLIISCFLMSACSSNKVLAPAQAENTSIEYITKDIGQRAVYVKKDNDAYICLEPMPDAVRTRSRELMFGLQKMGSGEESDVDNATGAMSLGGMNPEVLIASELMYRACELAANLNADEELSLKIYWRFLEAIEKIAISEKSAGVSAIVANPAVPGELKGKSIDEYDNSDQDEDSDDSGDDDDNSDDSSSDDSDYYDDSSGG